MTSTLWNLLFFAIALGLLVVIHEGGHFLAAKWCKVKVYRFSIGLGPIIYRRTMRDGTEFALSLIPMGGYVKMKGENDDESKDKSSKNLYTQVETDFAHVVSSQDDNDSFANKTIGQRAFIIAAGPLSNIILSVILYTSVNMLGITTLLPVVSMVQPNSLAHAAQLKEEDLIKEIDGSEVNTWMDFINGVISNVGDKVEVTVADNIGHGSERQVTLDLRDLNIEPKVDILESLGFSPLYGRYPDRLSFVLENSVAAKAGIKEGDKVIAINGITTPTWPDVSRAIKLNKGNKMLLEYERDGKLYQVELIPESKYSEIKQKEVYSIGVGIGVEKLDELYYINHYGLVDGFVKACNETVRTCMFILETTKKMVVGAISTKNIAGPIAMAKGAGKSAEVGLSTFLWFIGLLSINLGVINLLPIPILDGGQLVYLAYEKVTGRRPNHRVQMILTALGLTILLSLTILAIFNDLAAL